MLTSVLTPKLVVAKITWLFAGAVAVPDEPSLATTHVKVIGELVLL
jgi:hypothetical protein